MKIGATSWIALAALAGCAHGPVYQALAAAGGTDFMQDPFGQSASVQAAKQCDDARADGGDLHVCIEAASELRRSKSFGLAHTLYHEACTRLGKDRHEAPSGTVSDACYWDALLAFEGRPAITQDRAGGAAGLETLCAGDDHGDGAIAACARLARAAAHGEPPVDPARFAEYAERACLHEQQQGTCNTPSGQDCGRDDALEISAHYAGGACMWFGASMQHDDAGLPKDPELAARLLQTSAKIVAAQDAEDLSRERDAWNFDLGMCGIGTGVSAMSCAAQICPRHCRDSACLAACTEDAAPAAGH